MEAERLSPINQKLEYSALIGLFTQACRTPAKFEFFSEREGSFKAFYGIQPWLFHFLFNVIIQAKSHFAIFLSSVVSNFFALNMEQFEE